MPGRDFLQRSASDPEHIREACDRARRIVLCMTDQHIGNFVVSTPAIKALQRGFGVRADVVDAVDVVDVIVARGFVPLARRLLDPATIIAHDMPKSFLGDAAGLFRTRRKTRRKYDLLIGFSGGIRGSTLALLSGVRTTIGLDRYRRSGLYTLRIRDEQSAPALGRYAQFGVCVGAAEPIIEPFTPLKGDASAIKEALLAAGVDPDEPLTIIHPGAGKTHRRWPVERFALIADHVIEKHAHTVGVLTAPGEESASDDLLGAMHSASRARRLALPLGMLMPLFDHARALVCNESGPMHLAAMTRCAIVALFGPTDPNRWSPIRKGPDVVVLRAGDRTDAIQVETVIEVVDQTLAPLSIGAGSSTIGLDLDQCPDR